jgi:hypothetical protein
MQVAKPIILYLPEKLMVELEKHIEANPPSWKYDPVQFQYLVHFLTVRQIQQKNQDFFAINTQKLKSVTVWNIDRYIKYFINGEFLKRDYFINGQRSYHYLLNPELLQGFRRVELDPGTRLHEKIIQNQRLKRKNIDRLPDFLKQMRDFFMKMDLDYSEARNWIKSQPDESKKYSYLTSLAMFEDQRFRYFSRNKTNNRLDTNLTNLKSELRNLLIGDFVSIDLKNSQPFFLSQLLSKILLINKDNKRPITTTIPLCYSFLDLDLIQWFGFQQIKQLSKIPQNDPFFKNEELLNFQKSCTEGSFYNSLLSLIPGEELTRNQVKEMMFAVLFSRNEKHQDFKRTIPYQREKELFTRVYPGIYQAVHTLKRKDHTKLAVCLQRIESRIFIDTICPQLVELGIVPLTIHDCIIIGASQADYALEVCQSVFEKEFGTIPAFHVETLKHPMS